MSALATPLTMLNFLIAFGLIRLWWKHKESRRTLRWIAIPFVALYCLTTPPVCYLLLGSLEWRYPPRSIASSDVDAIVVLAGTIHNADSVRPEHLLGETTIERCLHAVDLHKSMPNLPILISSGPIDGIAGPPGAPVIRDFLVRAGVNRVNIILEERSRTTYENAFESARILEARGFQRIALVTSASHMHRASGAFQKQGLYVVPAPCGHIASEYQFDWGDLIADTTSALNTERAWHEWLGIAVYRLRGRL